MLEGGTYAGNFFMQLCEAEVSPVGRQNTLTIPFTYEFDRVAAVHRVE